MKKLTLAGISTGTAAKAAHPIVTLNDPEAAALLGQWIEVNPQFKILKNQNDTLAKQLAPHIKRAFFDKFAGIAAAVSTLLVQIGGRTVKLITKNSYSKLLKDDAPLIAAIGAKKFARWFRWSTVLKLDLDAVPEDKQEKFATAVIELAQKMGVADAVSATQCVQPVTGFHETRTAEFTATENIAIDALLPITAYPML